MVESMLIELLQPWENDRRLRRRRRQLGIEVLQPWENDQQGRGIPKAEIEQP